METAGINRCQGTPWVKELDGSKLHGALGGKYDLESKNLLFLAYLSRSQHINAPSIY